MEINRELLKAMKNGDQYAFKQVYELTVDNAYAVSYRILNNNEDSQEAVQNSYIKVFHKIKSFDMEKPFKPWLYRLVLNSAIDLYRRRKTYMERIKDFVSEKITMDDSSTKAENINEKLSDKDLLYKKIKALSIGDQKIVVLAGIEGMEYNEISKVLGMNVNTIKTKMRRIKQKLGGVYE